MLLPLLATAPTQGVTYGQKVVAAVLMAEAWGEGPKAMTAVAEVIRTRADKWGVSPLAVVKRERHFSCLNQTTPEQLIRKFHDKEDFKVALTIARTMYNRPEHLPDFAEGATHFDALRNRPYWAQGKRPVAVIGKLAFYKLNI